MKSVVIQGIKGSFHHEAVVKFFKEEAVKVVDSPTFNSLVKSVTSNQVDYGMMAIENSIAGTILPNYNLITKNNLHIVGEIALPIKHNLLALESETLESISEVQTHPMALLQCENFLELHPDWKLLAKDDTATCAKNIQINQLKGIASIGSILAAEMYNLKILQENIHDITDNFTRFYLLSKKPEKIKHFNKASLYFTVKHEMGSLAKVLNILAENEMNMTKIQSVPLTGSVFEYSFHVDVVSEKKGYDHYYKSLEEIRKETGFLHILGEYIQHKIEI
ncbi:prephenate dehydratase [Apibacter raozihei]|uniref:prephenate dehydratase n=1 Tax=Apibacter raozihei TaxID=2500547 RepID=UPI000FE32F08|nr:prephenate dehydratase [Apibacter raozihei]